MINKPTFLKDINIHRWNIQKECHSKSGSLPHSAIKTKHTVDLQTFVPMDSCCSPANTPTVFFLTVTDSYGCVQASQLTEFTCLPRFIGWQEIVSNYWNYKLQMLRTLFPPSWEDMWSSCNQSTAVFASVLCLSPDYLHSHNLASGLVDHVVDGAIRPTPDLAKVSQIFSSEVTVLLRRDLQLPWWLNAVCPQTLSGGGEK